MTRLSRLPENELVQRLTTVRQQFDALKAAPQTMGSTSVMLQRIASGNTYDFHVHAVYNVINCWELIFTPASSPVANAGLVWQWFINGYNPTGIGSQVISGDLIQPTGTSNLWKQRFWVIGSTPGQTFDYDATVIVYTLGKGTISVSQIQ